ncbi:MAG TPA: rhodanese-like domain-containing protein [Usitatibacter sp.]|nr:rhodanese-like domain-containing protein [Usitatibacter sp.]
MNAHDIDTDPEAILARAAERGRALGLAYAGAVTPAEAHALAKAGKARIVDVRTPPEYSDVGHVPGTPLVVWPRSGAAEDVRRFVEEVTTEHATDETLLFLCRSGARSHYAAHVLAQAGYKHAYNILEGFEGAQPGQGWLAAGLPWERGTP